MYKDSHQAFPGIGAAIARNLASKGASLVLGYTRDDSAEPTTKFCNELESSQGINALGVQADSGSFYDFYHLFPLPCFIECFRYV